MKTDKSQRIINLIRDLKTRAANGGQDAEEAVEIIRQIGWQAAASLQSLAYFSGEEAQALVQRNAEKNLSWPINFHAMKDARKGFDDPEEMSDHLNLGRATGYKITPKSKHRQLETHSATGWVFFLFGKMQQEGIPLTANDALRYLDKHPEIQVNVDTIHNRAASPNQSRESALREAIDTAIDSLRK